MFVSIETQQYAIEEGVWGVVGVFKVSVELEKFREEWEDEGERYLPIERQQCPGENTGHS